MNKLSRITNTSLAAVMAVGMGACSTVPQSKLPSGAEPNADFLEQTAAPVPVADLITAMKYQIALAVNDIYHAQGGPGPEKVFDFKNGTGTLTGNVQFIGTDTGSIAAVIPFGTPVSNVSPRVEISSRATSVQNVAFAFAIDPDGDIKDQFEEREKELAEYALELKLKGKDPEKDQHFKDERQAIDRAIEDERDENVDLFKTSISRGKIDPGKEIYNALTALYSGFSDIEKGAEGRILGPKVSPVSLQLTTSFAVQRTNTGGLSIAQIFKGGVGITSVTPGLTTVGQATGTYTLTMMFPLRAGDNGDNRRLFEVTNYGSEKSIIVEEPYTESRETELRGNASANKKLEDKENALQLKLLQQPSLPFNLTEDPAAAAAEQRAKDEASLRALQEFRAAEREREAIVPEPAGF